MGLLTILFLIAVAVAVVMYDKLRDRVLRLEREIGALRIQLDRLPERPVAEPIAVATQPAPESAPARSFTTTYPARAAPSEPEPAPEPKPEPMRIEPAQAFANMFERLVGGRLLIWIGGVALGVAGLFLVRYSIEIGLIGPRVRMIMAALFGLALLGAGEFARARRELAADPRIAQALVGAGVFVLYAATYGSLTLYGLISTGAASALMALITGAALLLSLRHGAGTAVMGLAGGFLTPLLVGNPDASALPLLFYLGLLNLALFALAWRRGWTWLAAAAALLSFVWTGVLLFDDAPDALAAGVFILLLGIAASLVRPGGGRQLSLVQPAAIAMVQLAALVSRTDLGLPAWLLFGGLALACLVLAYRRPEHWPLPPIALTLALLLLAGKAFGDPSPLLPTVAIIITLLFAGFGVALATRSERPLLWTAMASTALSGPVLIMRGAAPDLLPVAAWGALFAILACALGGLAWTQRAHARSEPPVAPQLLLPASVAALLLVLACAEWLPRLYHPIGWLAVALAAAVAARRLRDLAITTVACGAAALATLAAAGDAAALWNAVMEALAGSPALVTRLPGPVEALRSLALPAILLVALWRLLPDLRQDPGPMIAAVAALFGAGAAYIMFKQLFGLASPEDFVVQGLAERTVLTQALFAAGWAVGSGRLAPGWVKPETLRLVGRVLTGVAAARFLWFDLLLHNPAWSDQRVGPLPVLNLLLPACIGAAAWLYLARRRESDPRRRAAWLVAALLALIAGTALLVRQAYVGSLLTAPGLSVAENYTYSLAGLLLSILLLVGGVRTGDKPLRVAGLALLTATILKVFLNDAAELEGILRILSFMGLGVALIGIGLLYGKLLAADRAEGASPPDPSSGPSPGRI